MRALNRLSLRNQPVRFKLNVVHGRDLPRTIEVDDLNLDAAVAQAKRLGYTVLSARGNWRGINSTSVVALLHRRERELDVVVMAEQLRDLLASGLSVVEALNTLLAGASAPKREAIQALIQRLRSGERLSSAMAADAQFPALLVSLVEASELTADLPRALSRYAAHASRVRDLRNRLISVAIYPLMVVAVGLAVLLFLLLHVVPRFARMFEGMHGELPWSARAMVWWSELLGGWGPSLLLASAVLVTAAGLAAASRHGMRWWMTRVMGSGLLRRRMHVYFLSRWYRATGMLVEGGIPLVQALRLSNGLLPPHLQQEGVAVSLALQEGLSPAEAYRRASMATPVAEQLLLAGERIGNLGTVLTRLALFHEAEVERSLDRGMKTLEPVVMLVVGVGVGIIVALMYLPIFELASAIR
jgi:general secretion pathway protein F